MFLECMERFFPHVAVFLVHTALRDDHGPRPVELPLLAIRPAHVPRIVIVIGRVGVERENQQLGGNAVARARVAVFFGVGGAIQVLAQTRVVAGPIELDIGSFDSGVGRIPQHPHRQPMAADHLVVLHFEFRRQIVDFGIGVDVAGEMRFVGQREVPNTEAQGETDRIARIGGNRDGGFVGSGRRRGTYTSTHTAWFCWSSPMLFSRSGTSKGKM